MSAASKEVKGPDLDDEEEWASKQAEANNSSSSKPGSSPVPTITTQMSEDQHEDMTHILSTINWPDLWSTCFALVLHTQSMFTVCPWNRCQGGAQHCLMEHHIQYGYECVVVHQIRDNILFLYVFLYFYLGVQAPTTDGPPSVTRGKCATIWALHS